MALHQANAVVIAGERSLSGCIVPPWCAVA
jgi:hypothetical protein